VTLGFLIAASLVTFHKRTRGTELGRLLTRITDGTDIRDLTSSVLSVIVPKMCPSRAYSSALWRTMAASTPALRDS